MPTPPVPIAAHQWAPDGAGRGIPGTMCLFLADYATGRTYGYGHGPGTPAPYSGTPAGKFRWKPGSGWCGGQMARPPPRWYAHPTPSACTAPRRRWAMPTRKARAVAHTALQHAATEVGMVGPQRTAFATGPALALVAQPLAAVAGTDGGPELWLMLRRVALQAARALEEFEVLRVRPPHALYPM